MICLVFIKCFNIQMSERKQARVCLGLEVLESWGPNQLLLKVAWDGAAAEAGEEELR